VKYDLKNPCDNCPFRKDVSPYIRPARAEEIADALLSGRMTFSCHKTTTEKGRSNHHPKAQHCAGALIVLEKMGKSHQMMRIAERLGFYNYKELDMQAPVYDDLEEFIDAHYLEEES
jgi:hypothetical protein